MKPKFLGAPIANPEALARALRVSLQDLKTIAGGASSLYTDFLVKKRDGSDRNVSGPNYDLKILQKRINRQIFEKVIFPDYLYGGIPKRDYVQNAQAHSGARIIVAVDIENFYPSIKKAIVLKIFKYLFNFPDAVSEILANLCTKNNIVPQGACTSSYIANLVFYQLEPRLVQSFREQGLKYTRLIDDISVSANRPTSKKKNESVVESIGQMLKIDGFKLKHKKTKISSDANPHNLMEITGLWLNRGEPRVKRTERQEIRAEVRRCIREGKVERISDDYHKFHSYVSGRVAKLAHLKHPESKRYRKALQLLLPLYSAVDAQRTLAIADAICKTSIKNRATLSYVNRYHKAVFRINVLARTQPKLAREYRSKMNQYYPIKSKDDIIYG